MNHAVPGEINPNGDNTKEGRTPAVMTVVTDFQLSSIFQLSPFPLQENQTRHTNQSVS